ncbi:MAG: glucose-6-phosphate dehydrogenase [bacterium]|nr:glucose-6-phosphate dehydrogenase [bacterium]
MIDKNHKEAAPTIFIIFGITGDLAGRKLLPALLALYSRRMLPKEFSIIGISRRIWTREDFRQFIREHIKIRPGQYKEEDVKHFIDHIEYEQGLFDSALLYESLKSRIANIENRFKRCCNKLFHLSVPSNHCEPILKNLSELKLHEECSDELGWTRVLVEKPFGNDIDTAIRLDKLLASLFREEQIFRIDHYLAKEALQNILTFRFANSLFEPLWNHNFIDRVHIRLLEKNDVSGRATFYDSVGALKDVGQNHLLQMLALTAMEEPNDFNPENIRKERARVLKNLEPFPTRNLKEAVVRAQYKGYENEKGVAPASQTETYFLLKTFINNQRWANVPFFLESGRALKEAKTEICIYFKDQNTSSKKSEKRENVLVFRIQPDEGIKIRFWVKTPGFPMLIEPKTLSFKYSDIGTEDAIPDAYEKLIHDAIWGDQTLFASTDEVIYAWKYITPIIRSWGTVTLLEYPKGSMGPIE